MIGNCEAIALLLVGAIVGVVIGGEFQVGMQMRNEKKNSSIAATLSILKQLANGSGRKVLNNEQDQ